MATSYYYDTVFLDNPMAFYALDEIDQGDGQTAYDTANAPAYAFDATYYGTPPSTNALPLVSGGEKGTVLGSSNYISVPALEMWSRSRETSSFTVEMWFLLNGDNQTGIRLFQPYVDSNPVENNYIGIEDGQVIFKVGNADNTKGLPDFTVVTHDLEEPRMAHHLLAIYDAGYMFLYIDQKLVGANKIITKGNWNFNATSYRVSGPAVGSVTVDAIGLYKLAITPDSIQRHYLLGRSTIGSQEIAAMAKGHFFPIDDTDSDGVFDADYPQDANWPTYSKSNNIEKANTKIGLVSVTSPDTVDDNVFFTGGALQLLPGEKMLSDDMSTFNKGVNMLENASFDVDVNADGVPDLWTTVNTAGGGSTVTLSTNSVSSQNSVCLTLGATSTGNKIGVQTTNKIAVKEIVVNDPGNPFGILPVKLPTPEPFDPTGGNPNKMVLTFDALSTLPTQLFNVRILQWNGGSALADTVIPVTLGNTWSRRQAIFDILSDATDIVVQFEIVSNGSATGQVYIDNALLELGYAFNEYVDGWFKYSNTGTLPRMVRGDVYDSGIYSLKLECSNATATSIGIQSERMPADPDDVIYARCSANFALDAAGTESIEIWYDWYDLAGAKIGSTITYSKTIASYGSYIPVYTAKKAPANTAAVQVSFIAKSTSALGSGREIYFDNVYINDVVGEAAQYLVVEELSRIASANEGAAGVGFYLDSFQQEQSREFAIMSMDDDSGGIQIVKKYNTTSTNHEIVLRHTYIENGLPIHADTAIKTLSGGDWDAWHYVLLAWSGDLFSVAIDAGTWVINQYDTAQYNSFQLSYYTELTVGAGIDGMNGLGTQVKNVKVYDYIPSTDTFVTDQTANGNYYLPLSTGVNICMKGYAEFEYDLLRIYDAIEDAKVEWGPVNNSIKLYGRPSKNINLLTADKADASVGSTGHQIFGGISSKSITTQDSANGNSSVKAIGSNTDNFVLSTLSNLNTVTEGNTYTGIIFAKNLTGSTQLMARLAWIDKDQNVLTQPFGTYIDIDQSGWKEMRVSAVAPANAVSVWVFAYGPATSHTILLDKWGIFEGTGMEWAMPPQQLSSGGEPAPLKGGYCPSLVAPQYYIRAEFETTDLIYRPAQLNFLSLTFLDNVKFKTKTANHVLKPTGSFTVATKSTPIINQFDKNGVKFTKAAALKNFVPNGGFTYDTQGWVPHRDSWCTLERSVDEYVSGGSSLKVTALKNEAQFMNVQTSPRGWYRSLISDLGDNGFGYSSNCTAIQSGDIKRDSGYPVIKVTKTASGSDHMFGMTRTNGKRFAVEWGGITYTVSLKVLKKVAKPLTLVVEQYDSSNTLLGTQTTTLNTANTDIWEDISVATTSYGTSATICAYIKANNSDAWAANDVFYVADFMFDYDPHGSSGFSFDPYYLLPYYSVEGWPAAVPGLTGNTQYTISAKFKTPVGQLCNAKILVIWNDSSYSNIGNNSTSSEAITDSQWTTVSGTFTSPANTASARIRFTIENTIAGNSVYVDEVQLEASSSVTAYEDYVPSGMYLTIADNYLVPKSNDAGYMETVPRQQKIGTIEQWIKYDDADPGVGTTLTVLENRSGGDVSGVYYTNAGITYTNMTAVYLDGASIPSGSVKFTRGKWHHLVALPNYSITYFNYIKNPAVVGTTSWTAGNASTTIAAETIGSPGDQSALAMTWTSATPPTTTQFSAYTNAAGLGAGRYCTVSFYAQSPVTSRSPFVHVSWRNSSNVEQRYSYTTYSEPTIATGWTRYYTTFYTPSNTDNANIYIGFTNAAQNEKHYIAGIMMVNEGFPTPYFDGSTANCSWEGTVNNSRSILQPGWTTFSMIKDANVSSKWFWNTSYNGLGQMSATYSNIAIYENALSAQEVLDNYTMALSRGNAITASDKMENSIGGSYPKIYDGIPWSISAPWQVLAGSA